MKLISRAEKEKERNDLKSFQSTHENLLICLLWINFYREMSHFGTLEGELSYLRVFQVEDNLGRDDSRWSQ